MLVKAERGVTGIGPWQPVALIGVVRARHHGWVIARAHGAAVTGSMGDEQRLPHQPPADPLIHPVDLGGIDGHPASFPLFVRRILPGGRPRVTRSDWPPAVNDPQIDHSPVAAGAHGIPSPAVCVLVVCDVLRERVQRPVRRRVGNIQEERLLLSTVRFHEASGVVTDRVRVVVGIANWLDRRVITRQGDRIVVAAGARDSAVESLKASLKRPVVFGRGFCRREVPLARHQRVITGRAQHLGYRETFPVQVTAIGGATVVLRHVADAGLMRIQAR